MPTHCVSVRTEAEVGWMELDRPPTNLFDREMFEVLHPALRRLLDDPEVRVVVLASALDRYFSAGGDLRFFQGLTPEGLRRYQEDWRQVTVAMRASRKPLLAAVHGTVVGGGFEMALLCDIRFATADARLGLPEVNIGFFPQMGSIRRLARMLGPSRALRFLLDGTCISATEAAALGLVDVVVKPDRLREEVQSYATAIASKPRGAVAAIRRCVNEGFETSDEGFFPIEIEEAALLWGGPEITEGMDAFLEKRPPRWSPGRE
jgi:enoyl-CoA hydratase/carnithine racemase